MDGRGGFTIPSLRFAAISALAGSILRGRRDPPPAFLQPLGAQVHYKLSRADSDFACYWSQSYWQGCGAATEHSFSLDSETAAPLFSGRSTRLVAGRLFRYSIHPKVKPSIRKIQNVGYPTPAYTFG